MEHDGDSPAVSPKKLVQSDILDETRARPKVYTREYLLSFANLSFCQTKPDGLDSAIWREAQAADVLGEVASISGAFSRPTQRDGESDSSTKSFRDIPEWRRSSVHPGSLLAQQSSRRKSYDDDPPSSPFSNNYPPKQTSYWGGENTQSRNNHDRQAMPASRFMAGQEKWGHRGDREREKGRFHSNRESNGSSGHSHGVGISSIQTGRKPAEQDGLLGSGESSKGTFTGGLVGLSPTSKAVGKYVLASRGSPTSISNDTFHYSKALLGPRHQGAYAINDETFGEEQCSEERSEQERKRRESFELMRQESKKSIQEQQSFELKNPEEQNNYTVDQIVDKSHVADDTWDDSHDLEHMISTTTSSKSLIHDSPLLGSAMKTSTTSVARPVVPPGFAEVLLKANEHNKSCDKEQFLEKTEESQEEEKSILKDCENDSKYMVAEKLIQSSCSHANMKTTEGTEGPMIELVNSSGNIFDESGSILKKASGNALTEVDGDGQIPGSFFLSESQADSAEGDSGPKMSKFAKWFPPADAEGKWKHATSVGDSASNMLFLFSGSDDSGTITNEASFKSFEEIDRLKDERSPSNLLLPLKSPGQVLPMPLGPSLEDIEKDMTLAANGKEENFFPPGSTLKNGSKVLPANGRRNNSNRPEVSGSTKVSKVFLTCEDIEQSLLAEAGGYQEQAFYPAEPGQSTTSSLLSKEGEAPNFFASQHLLSLLHKSSAASTPRGKDSHSIPKEEMYKRFTVNEPTSERKQYSQDKEELASEPTLEALFGKAFMSELRSLEAPVSAQSFPSEMKAAHGVFPSDITEVNRTLLPPDAFSHSHLQKRTPRSTHRYIDKKDDSGFLSVFPVERYEIHGDERGNHPTDNVSASQWPPTENPDLLLDILAGRPSKNSFASSDVPFPRISSGERLERDILERKASGGSKKSLHNVMANFEGQSRLNAVFDNMVSDASADQQLLEDLMINKDMEGNFQGRLNLRDQLFGHANSSPVIPMVSGTGITSRGKIPESRFLDNVVLESVLDEIYNTGHQMNRQRERGSLGDVFSQMDATTNAVPFKKVGQRDEKNLGSHRVIDAFQQGNKEGIYQSVAYDAQRIGRAERFSKDTNAEFENKFGSDILNSASASGSLNTLRISSSPQHSHSSFPLKSSYRSHSPVTTLSAEANISLDHLQQALVYNDPISAFHSSGAQAGRQHFHSQPDPLLHHMITGNKMISSAGLRNQQHSASARPSSSSVPNRAHFQGHPDTFLNPNSVPQTMLPPLLGNIFPPGQFPPHGFGPSINMHSNMHEQSPYDSHGFGMPVAGYVPSSGPLHPLLAHLSSPFHNLELHRALHMEQQPIPGQGQPNVVRDFNRRLPRMPPHWN